MSLLHKLYSFLPGVSELQVVSVFWKPVHMTEPV